jgi:hypothetical protein
MERTGIMQNSRLLTIEGRLKVKILSGVIMLLLVGLHPVRVHADASNSTADSSNTAAAAPADTTTDSTTTGPTQTIASSSDPTAGSSSTADTSSSSTQPTNSSDATSGGSATASPNTAAISTSAAPSAGTDSIAPTDTSGTTVTNQETSSAQSGDASVTHSSKSGDATSGDAQTIATALNILNSSTDVQNNNIDTSVTNISGNSNNQDMVIDPTTSDGTANSQSPNETEVNTSSSGTISNNLTLGATSGDATVSGNRAGGNATSGDATVDANLVNVTNSNINSGQYYIGVINIYGDLSGNILLSPGFVSQLLSENPSLLSGDSDATNTVNQTINNQINASAISGGASVENNFLGGNATSGNATTSVDTFDLANSDITGNNALLVFINVLGTWEGVIIGAPAGATTAVYGDSTSIENLANSASTTDSDSQATLASATNEEIDNTINATATSGDATVADNGIGGNATSGNAEVGVNLLNILNSDVSLSGWFGVLFINVFGDWSGDLGVITPVETTVATTTEDAATNTVKPMGGLGKSIANDAYNLFDQSTISMPTPGQVLGTTISAETTSPINNYSNSRVVASTIHSSNTRWMPAVAGMTLGAASLGLERVLRKRKEG